MVVTQGRRSGGVVNEIPTDLDGPILSAMIIGQCMRVARIRCSFVIKPLVRSIPTNFCCGTSESAQNISSQKTVAAERAITAVAKEFVEDNRKAVPNDFLPLSVLQFIMFQILNQ